MRATSNGAMKSLWRHGVFILFVSLYFSVGISMLNKDRKNKSALVLIGAAFNFRLLDAARSVGHIGAHDTNPGAVSPQASAKTGGLNSGCFETGGFAELRNHYEGQDCFHVASQGVVDSLSL